MLDRSRTRGRRRRARRLATLAGGALIFIGAAVAVGAAAPHPARHQPPWSATASASTASASTVSGSASRPNPGAGAAPRIPYSLLQMNLCLSGFAECFKDAQYPKVVKEAIEVIAAREPDAVSINESCSSDVTRIAEQTRYHARFAPVLVRGRPLPCVDPAGRGVFGNAVITKEAIDSSAGRAFAAQVRGQERRRWMCVQTVRDVTVCTTHLSTPGPGAARAAHRGQCAEFAAMVASRDPRGPVIAAGDINDQDSCAPAGVWMLNDARSSQLPGIQHSYGSAEEFRHPRVQVLPATHSDHDFMLTRTRLQAPRGR